METKCLQIIMEAHGDLRNSIHMAEHSLRIHPRRIWKNVSIGQYIPTVLWWLTFYSTRWLNIVFYFCKLFVGISGSLPNIVPDIAVVLTLWYCLASLHQQPCNDYTRCKHPKQTNQLPYSYFHWSQIYLKWAQLRVIYHCNAIILIAILLKGPVIIDLFVRWQLLALLFSFCLVSHPIRKIYPNLSSLQTAGSLMIRPFFFRLPCYFFTINIFIYIFQSRITNSRRKADHRRLSFD
jgi:hypothetical protein